MWGQLAQLAIRTFQTELLVLLGDDIEMRPPAWVDMVSGGPELCSAAYTPPLYKRVQLPHSVFKRQLAVWQGHLQQQALPHASPHLTLDVAIPSYRANPVLLEKLLTCSVTEPSVSVRFLLQIDQPKLPTAASSYISDKQEQLMHMLRVRHNKCNIGAGMTRNALLEASAAQYVVFFDDDVEPSVGCLDAYVQAARQHPEAAGFAGPTCLPHGSGLVAAAVQLSDVGFFWEAPSSNVFPKVPWAVTANMMIKNTDLRCSPDFASVAF
ncbi:hypothetical protein WJX77_004138 [Trebouxia sp. C0004]